LPDNACLSGVQKVGNELRGLTLPVSDLKRVGVALTYLLRKP
jgi:hypothetical protein